MVNTVFSIVPPSYRVWDIEKWLPTPGKCIQGTSLESVNIILSAKRVFAILIQDLEMDRSSRVIQVSPKLYKCPYKRDDRGGGALREDSQRRRCTQRAVHVTTEAWLECHGSKPWNPPQRADSPGAHRTHPASTFVLDSDLLTCKRIHFCLFKPPSWP